MRSYPTVKITPKTMYADINDTNMIQIVQRKFSWICGNNTILHQPDAIINPSSKCTTDPKNCAP